MEHRPSNERLAGLEAKMEILLGLLKEIRDELKSNPSREEYETLVDRVHELEESTKGLLWKVALAAGSLSVLVGIAVELFRK